jgi:23S rRNA pseudouridine2605 synthase
VNGRPLRLPKRPVYFKLHKPRGILSDIGGDTRGRKTAADLLPAEMRRVFPVGRLDLHSEGLMLLTDDGKLAHHLTHPRFEHAKVYYVLVEERPSASALEQLRSGVELPEGRTAPAEARVVSRLPPELTLSPGPLEGVWLEIVLREGKKRQIRQMTAAVGHPALRLVRWAIGPLTLGALKSGESAPLAHGEVAALRQSVQNSTAPGKRRSSTRRREKGDSPAPGRRSRHAPSGKRSDP